MYRIVIVLIVSFIGLSAFSVPERVQKKADKVISKHFDLDDYSKEYIRVSASENKATPSGFTEDNFFRILDNGKHIAYGYIGNAPSKTATFDYIVIFDIDFIITKSAVLVYREEYGGEISSTRWLKQFTGSSSTSPELKYNQDIIPISGATISVRSMTKAMNDLLKSIRILKDMDTI